MRLDTKHMATYTYMVCGGALDLGPWCVDGVRDGVWDGHMRQNPKSRNPRRLLRLMRFCGIYALS